MIKLLYLIMLANLLLLFGCVAENKVLLSNLNQQTAKLIEDIDTSRIDQIKVCYDWELYSIVDKAESYFYNRSSYWQIIDSLGINNVSSTDSLIIFEQYSSGEVVTYHAIVYKSNKLTSTGCMVTIEAGSDFRFQIVNNKVDVHAKIRRFDKWTPIICTSHYRGLTKVFFICNNHLINVEDLRK